MKMDVRTVTRYRSLTHKTKKKANTIKSGVINNASIKYYIKVYNLEIKMFGVDDILFYDYSNFA